MIKLENEEVIGWEAAIRGMRNPHNSWENSDTYFFDDGEYYNILGNSGPCGESLDGIQIGPNDHDRMMSLSKAGTDHRKYMRMIVVYVDILAPLYWWKEFDTYKVGTVANSCSTMHKIADKEFTLDDFSHEHLLGWNDDFTADCVISYGHTSDEYPNGDVPLSILIETIQMLNEARNLYIETKDKKYWWQMIQLLPSSYNQRRTIMLNYEVLANIYKSRKGHKLDEWCDFCKWIKFLPYSEIITVDD